MIAFFHVPILSSPLSRVLYMTAIIMIGFAAYSLFSVPYLTMAAEIVPTSEQRRMLMSFRVIFMAVGLTLGAFSGDIIQFGGGGLAGYSLMSWLFGGVCLLTMLTTVFATGFARHGESVTARMGIGEQVRVVLGNRRFRLLWSAGFLQKMGEGIGYGSFAYFCIYVAHQPLDSLAFVVLSGAVAQTLVQPLWVSAARRWSQPALYSIGVLGWCLHLAAWMLMKGQPQWYLLPLGFASGLASGGFLTITLAMLSDLLAEDTLRTGENREGVYSGFWLAGEKMAFALGALVVGLMLQAFGFKESTAGALHDQTERALLGIELTYVGVNILIYVASTLPIWAFAVSARRPES